MKCGSVTNPILSDKSVQFADCCSLWRKSLVRLVSLRQALPDFKQGGIPWQKKIYVSEFLCATVVQISPGF